MISFLFKVTVATMAGLVAPAAMYAGDGANGCVKSVAVVCTSAGGGQKVCATAGEGQAGVVCVAVCPSGTGPGSAEAAGPAHSVMVVPAAYPGIVEAVVEADEAENDPNAGWLGIHAEPVPDALAAQLGVDGNAMLIDNVVTDSPADEAGLQRYDIITGMNGEPLTGGFGDFAVRIREAGADTNVTLDVIRAGSPISVKATLGAHQGSDFNFKFEFAPDAEWQERIQTRGHFVEQDESGNWVMRDLGDVELPEDVRVMLPNFHGVNTQVFISDGGAQKVIEVNRDGETIKIEQDNDGPITVQRTENGQTTENTYDDLDALRAADPDAAEILEQQHEGAQMIKLNVGDLGDIEAHAEAWAEGMEDLSVEMEGSIEGMAEELGEHFQDITVRKMGDGAFWFSHGQGAAEAEGEAEGEEGAEPRFLFHALPSGKVQRSFMVKPNGEIEYRIRDGGDELVRTFADEDDLRRQDPELYERFKELKLSDE